MHIIWLRCPACGHEDFHEEEPGREFVSSYHLCAGKEGSRVPVRMERTQQPMVKEPALASTT